MKTSILELMQTELDRIWRDNGNNGVHYRSRFGLILSPTIKRITGDNLWHEIWKDN